MSPRTILRITVLGVFAVLSVLSVRSYYAVRMREGVRAVMCIGMEDVAQRVRETSRNRRVLKTLSDNAALAKARAFARLVAKDAAALARPGEMERIAADLDVEELHVSDERGRLIHSLPASYQGYDMASQAQSAAFMPALTNRNFALVQEPMSKGIETNVFQQYVGVARQDRPGIVQVGYCVERREQEDKLADIGEIEKSSRLGLGCSVRILPREGLPPPAAGIVRRRLASGERVAVVETDCGDWRIRVSCPAAADWLGEEENFRLLIVGDLILALIFIFAFPALMGGLRRDLGDVCLMFGGRFTTAGAFRRAVRNPVTIVCGSTFVLAVALTWLLTSHAAKQEARAQLKAASVDMCQTVNDCADSLLFYQGLAIVNHYKKPESMTVDTIAQLMQRYGLDEMNVVDGKGLVLAGALAEVGYDMSSHPNTAPFNCLLFGARTFSQHFRAPVEDPKGERLKYAGVAFPWPTKGYIQIGFKESRLRNGIDFWFEDAAVNRHIGERGYFIIADSETGLVKSSGYRDPRTGATMRRGMTLAEIGYDVQAEPPERGTFFHATLFGEECLCLSEVDCFHRIICALPISEIAGAASHTALVSLGALLAVFVLVVYFMTRLTNLVASIKEKDRLEHERQLKDLTLAKTIQLSSLPVVFPDESDYRIRAGMTTAREVGGDFYDFYTLPDGRVFVLVADVSGKGVPAALFMMKAKATLRAAVSDGPDDLSRAVQRANDALSEQNDAEMFVTAWFGLIDLATGELQYVNAGHNPPLLRHTDGSVTWVRGKRSLVLAAMSGVSYRTETCRLACGETLFLYTDGVTEAMNAAGELYGEDRLESCLRAAGLTDLVSIVRADVARFVGSAEQSDDITLLSFDYKKAN